MSAPSGIGPGSIQRTGEVQVDVKSDVGSTGRASFGNSLRTVSEAKVTVSLADEVSLSDADSEVSDTELSERSVEDVTDKQPGKLKRAAAWLGGKAKAKAQAAKDGVMNTLHSGYNAGKAVGRGTKQFVQHPMASSREMAHSAGDYVQGKYQGAKSAGASAKSKIGSGLHALKDHPKEAIKSGLKAIGRGIKTRTISLAKGVKKMIPSRPKSLVPAKVKSLFSRSAKSVPPNPSVSVKLWAQATPKQEAIRTQSSERSDNLKQTREARENNQLLNQLLDNPTSLSRSSQDYTLRFPGGEVVEISGSRTERAQSTRDAVGFANQYRSEIRQGKDELKQLEADIKSENKKAAKSDKKAISEERKAIASDEKTDFQAKADELKEQRSEIKQQISGIKADIKAETQKDKDDIKVEEDSLKTAIKSDEEYLKSLKEGIKDDQQQLKKDLKFVEDELKSAQQAVKKYEQKLEKDLSSIQESSAQAGLDKASAEVERLLTLISIKEQEFEGSHQGIDEEVQQLTDELAQKKAALKDGFEASDSKVAELKEQLAEAEELLKENTEEMKQLKSDYQAAKKAIKKMK